MSSHLQSKYIHDSTSTSNQDESSLIIYSLLRQLKRLKEILIGSEFRLSIKYKSYLSTYESSQDHFVYSLFPNQTNDTSKYKMYITIDFQFFLIK